MDPSLRLYLEDPDLLEFDAEIREARPLAGGEVGLVLDRSAFYPTSGGQPFDTGTLDDEPVLEVTEADDGSVVHRVRRRPQATRVHGRVDAERRRDHMQQHSGQHLLSATCVALVQRETLSFHLGAERCSIDLVGAPFDAATLDAIERRTNAIVWEARPVRARLLSPGEVQELRKGLPAGVETVRVVEIEGWDRNACCGTHVRSTSAIGLVKLLGQERVTGGTRLHFACGARALAACATAQSRLEALVRLLGCGAPELEARCDKLLADSRGLRKENDTLQASLQAARAAVALAAAPRVAGVPVVVETQSAGGAAALRELASALVEAGAVALLGRAAERAELLFARPDAVELDLRPALQAACALIEGKGGGPPGRVQGAGSRLAGLPAALDAARAEVVRALEASRESF